MDKCREAFEKLPEIQKRLIYLDFDEGKQDYFLKKYSQDFRFVNLNYVRSAWWAWQSRQVEFDAMTEALLKQTQLLAMKQAEINQLQSQINEMAEVGVSQESVIREKDKKLKAVEQILIELKESMTNFKEMDLYDKGVRVVTDCIIRDLEKALRGEHE